VADQAHLDDIVYASVYQPPWASSTLGCRCRHSPSGLRTTREPVRRIVIHRCRAACTSRSLPAWRCLLLERLDPLSSRNDQHRNVAVVNDIVAHAAQEHGTDSGAAARAHDHQVVLTLTYLFEHHLRGRSACNHRL
jgi:hypothetical protein